jgi:negative regulator of genetic competence, sporulation and motility
MAGRGPQSFKKRQKEQQRKEKQMEKAARRLERKTSPLGSDQEELKVLDRPYVLPEFQDLEEVITPVETTTTTP